jgi:hypothetical protein
MPYKSWSGFLKRNRRFFQLSQEGKACARYNFCLPPFGIRNSHHRDLAPINPTEAILEALAVKSTWSLSCDPLYDPIYDLRGTSKPKKKKKKRKKEKNAATQK